MKKPPTLFPTNLPPLQWCEFSAAGFSHPVCGVIYREGAPATCGMPLGGIDTGCLDLETTGLLGLISIFNSLTPRRGPLNVPFLGVKVNGETHLLAAIGLPGVKAANAVHYWGHYPIADMEFELDSPLSVGLRAWSPFIPGDVEASTVPGIVFEVHLRNNSSSPLAGKLAISFPGHARFENGHRSTKRQKLEGELTGVFLYSVEWQTGEPNSDIPTYALAVEGAKECVCDYGYGLDPAAWERMGEEPLVEPLPEGHNNADASIAVDWSLEAHGRTVVRFILTWCAAVWNSAGIPSVPGRGFRHMYAKNYGDARQTAKYLLANRETLLRRILAWQQEIYTDAALPGWLADSLVNILHLMTETGVWAQAKEPIGPWCKEEDGLFGMNECPRMCPQIECIPCSFYGSLPVVYFFPHLAQSTLRGEKAYQFPNGRPTWVFGGCTVGSGFYEMAMPAEGYQQSLNGCCLVELVDKLWRRTGSDEVVREFYEMCKKATDYTMTMRPEYGDKQVISMPTGNAGTEWFEADKPGWSGMCTHIGGIRLAHLLMMERMAKAVGDNGYAAQCRKWFEAGSKAMEEHLWADKYYLNFNEPETNTKSELVFGYQIDGQWIAKFHGDGDAFPPERVRTTLETIKRCNVANSKTGAVNYANADGSPAKVGGYGTYSYFPPEVLMLAMTYMYDGQKHFGLELARKCWENIVCKQRLTWDQPNIFRGDVDTGERTFGADYYQNMMLWSLVAAVEGGDLSAPCHKGGLVERMIEAGKDKT